MEMEKINDYSTTTQNLIPSRLKNKPNFNGILSTTDKQFEDLENAAYQIMNDIWLDTAIGVQLDLVGRILGLRRAGRDDETYRSLLYLKVDINTGGGNPELLIRAVTVLYSASEVHYIPNYPAGVIIQHNGSIGLFLLEEMELDDGQFMLLDDGRFLYVRTPDTASSSLMEQVVPSGVELEIQNI